MTTLTVLAGVALLAAGCGLGWWVTTTRCRRRDETALARARSELTRRLNELFSLQELTYVLSESIHLDRIAEQVARFVIRFIPCDGTLVALESRPEIKLRVAAAEGSLSALVGTETEIAEDTGLVGMAMTHEHLQMADDSDGRLPELLPGVAVRRAAAAPLRSHGMTVGAVAVVKDSEDAFGQQDLRLLSTIATHAAMALANARFFDLIRGGKKQWETTFDALADGVAVVDDHGRIRRANHALATLLGKPLPEVIGLDLCDALFWQSAELIELLDAARAGVQPPPLSSHSEELDLILRITVSPYPRAGAVGWVVALIEDVTEQKALEAQLIQAEKMAAVGQLVSGVAHELNNPLTSISGLSEFLLERPSTTEREREHIRVIHEQAERAARIVQNLLTFARHSPIELANVDLNEITRRATALIDYELRLREIELETDLADQVLLVHGDRNQLQQVVLNLLTNAVQAASEAPPERPRVVRLSTALTDDEIVLRVADTGPGVPSELLPKIFDPFVTTKRPGQGTGLGLSITYRIVQGLGGRLSVQRAAEGGALFVVTLPASACGAATTKPPTNDITAESQAPSADAVAALTGRSILLVDDDPAVRRMIGVLFAQDGQHIEAAQDAAHAVELLEHKAYDLILADPRAAVSAGESFAAVLCTRHPHLKARTIFLTADVRPETTDWLGRLGCRYFQKPFNVRELRAAAAEILSPT
ncbi:MAG: response regulator [Gemmatimonadales bacterium]|nr:response regulator [Gemmatimonadales bacterium]NIN09789.1 response regulator [Gemmatimonadales bacterium]NIN48771.1 response regulator [Gemmatimonadales bacterium]NIP06235.1 response regulator [Gemmatimonadales bacterium]NIR02656.1 response regulator [Gemmatimonadales bacterium]